MISSSIIQTYRVVVSTLVLMAMSLASFPQAQESDSNALKERAWLLVESLGPQIKQWNDYRDQVVVSIKLADLLWERNEQLSRDTFVAAFRAIPLGTSETPKEEQGFRQELQIRVLSGIARRDPQLAETLTRELIKPKTDDPSHTEELSENERTERAQLLIQQAGLLAMKDLKGAASLMEEALKYKLVRSVAPMLEFFAGKDREIAARLYHLAFMQARTQRFSDGALEIMLIVTARTRNVTPPLYNPDQVKELLVVLERELSEARYQSGTDRLYVASEWIQVPTVVSLLKQLIPLYEQYLPEQLPSIQVHLSAQIRSLNELQRMGLQYGSPSGAELTVAQLLSQAEKEASPRARDVLYSFAVERARKDGDFTQALSIAEKIQDARKREGQILSIQISMAMAAVGADNFAQALSMVKKVSKEKCERTMPIYYEIAQSLMKQGSPEQAVAIITEAKQCWSNREATVDAFQAAGSLTLLADALLGIDEQSCFLLCSSIVEWLNRYTESKDKNLPQRGPDQGVNWATLPINGYGYSAGGKRINRFVEFEKILAQLAQKDFDRTILIVTALKSPALRAVAQLAACSGIIHNNSEKAMPSSSN
jgi:hypothetical protein